MTDQEFLQKMLDLRLRYRAQIEPFAERARQRNVLLQAIGELLSDEDTHAIDQIVSAYRDTPNTEAYWSEARHLFQSFFTSPE